MAEPNGKDPVVERLDYIVELLRSQQELIEEVVEKLADLDLPYNSI